ncbi:hypothetical protein HID58_077752 [Brassica napus]|uniref:HIT domain-containing protein n=1 Tax=Brassica napus TaxID=3708 RepID=A0ABQ7YR79_BRANA|nr:hypothetical protein HID58_077752 [Brassica napus]
MDGITTASFDRTESSRILSFLQKANQAIVEKKWRERVVYILSVRSYAIQHPTLVSFTPMRRSSRFKTSSPPLRGTTYLVIPVEHIPTVRDLQRRDEDYSLGCHMLSVGNELLHKDAPQTLHRFGFHQPPFNSVDHLHLHCFALSFLPRWKAVKYKSLGPFWWFY